MADEIRKENEVKEEAACCCSCGCEDRKDEAAVEEKCGCGCEDRKDEAAVEEKCGCGCEDKKDETAAGCECGKKCSCFLAPAEGDSAGKKIAKGIARVLILVVILALALFFFMKNDIYNIIYQDYETATIKNQITAMLDEGLKDSGFAYTIVFVKPEDATSGRYYRIDITNKNGKEVGSFAMYGMYDRALKQAVAKFYGDDRPETSDEIQWKSIKVQAATAKRLAAAQAAESK